MVEGISTTQQATMQRTVSQPPSTEHLQERVKSLINNMQHLANTSAAAPAASNPSSDAMLTSTISSNTLRRDSSTISMGRRSGSTAQMLLQQVRQTTSAACVISFTIICADHEHGGSKTRV